MMIKSFAFYLPQFHACDANDAFWGKNFTDWVTTGNAIPLYSGHVQPKKHLMGEYDLADPLAIKAQCNLAKEYGLTGFAIYHYWFDSDQRALHKPIDIIRNDPALGIEYFVSWVNADWTMSWIGKSRTVIRKQSYNKDFFQVFIDDLIKHFKAPHYCRIGEKPILYIHKPDDFDVVKFINLLRGEVLKEGFNGVYLIAPDCHLGPRHRALFDAVVGYPPGDFSPPRIRFFSLLRKFLLAGRLKELFNRHLFKYVRTINYPAYIRGYYSWINRKKVNNRYIPTVLNGWDNTPRYGVNGFEFVSDTPYWQRYGYVEAIKYCKKTAKPFFLIKSWNEWAEGNTLEPCEIYGRSKLEALRDALLHAKDNAESLST